MTCVRTACASAHRGSFYILQVMKDPQTGLPRLEEHDAPLELFKGTALIAGLHVRELASVHAERKDAIDCDGSFCVLGIAWRADVFDRLLP